MRKKTNGAPAVGTDRKEPVPAAAAGIPILSADGGLAPELLMSIGYVIQNLTYSESTRITRRDLGVRVSGFYNWPFMIRIDLVRLDKRPFFAIVDET